MATKICWADFHIHSALSPCASDDQTPRRIVGEALAAGISVLALTDHNSCANCPAILEYNGPDFLILPGMELQTREEIHMICLFGDREAAAAWHDFVADRLPELPNRPDFFGRQLIFDSAGQVCATEPKLLLSSADIGYDDVFRLVAQYDGLAFPAHIDRPSFSVTASLGFIPAIPRLTLAEVSSAYNLTRPDSIIPGIEKLKLLRSSDAHWPTAIGRGRTGLPLENLAWDAVKDCLTGPAALVIAEPANPAD